MLCLCSKTSNQWWVHSDQNKVLPPMSHGPIATTDEIVILLTDPVDAVDVVRAT